MNEMSQRRKALPERGGGPLELSVQDDRKTVTIWLSKAEKNDPTVAQSLKPVFRKYEKQKYTVAVFKSGTADLWETTSALLVKNRYGSVN